MSLNTQNLEKVAFWVVLFTLIIGFFLLLAPFYSAILISLVLTLTFEPLYQFFLKWMPRRRYLSALFCLVLMFLFFAIPATAIFSLITEQVIKVAQTFGEQIRPNFLKELLGNGVITQILEQWQKSLGVEIDLAQWLKEILHNSAQYLYQFSPKVVSRTANFFINGLITLVLTFFMFVDGPKLYHEILDLSPLKNTYEKTLAQEIQLTLRACIYGQVLTAFVQATLAGIGFWIAGFQVALLLALATFIMCFVPIVGSASVWVPVFVYLLVTGQYGKAAFLFFYGFFIISGVDNILKPIFIQGKTNIHPVLLFLAIFGGLKLWGPIGLLAGPTLVAVLLATLKIYRQDFR